MGAINTAMLDAEIQLINAASNNIGKYSVGSKAVDLGSRIENTPTDGSNALLKNDKIFVPAEDVFDKYFFVLEPNATAAQQARGQKPRATCGIVCQVERGGTVIPMRVFAATFTRRTVKYKENEDGNLEAFGKFTEDDACDWPGKELDKTDLAHSAAAVVRAERSSLYNALKKLAGKELEVVGQRTVMTLGFSNSEYEADGSRKRVKRDQKVLDIKINEPAPAATAKS